MLLVAGGDDRLGDSAALGRVAMRHLRAHRRAPQADRLLYYSDAGHLITPMLQPTTFRHATGPYVPVGGSPAGYARADRDASRQVLGFPARALAVDPAAGRPVPAGQ